MEHDGCVGCKYEHLPETSDHCQGCTQNAVDKYARKTNADRIRSMTDEELAAFLRETVTQSGENMFVCEKYVKTALCRNSVSCAKCNVYLAWLKLEVEDNEY